MREIRWGIGFMIYSYHDKSREKRPIRKRRRHFETENKNFNVFNADSEPDRRRSKRSVR